MNYTNKNKCIWVILIFIISCKNVPDPKSDTPTSGTISLSTDESFSKIIKSEVHAFEYLYPEAKINVDYKSENESVMSFLNGTSDMIIIGRELYKDEIDFINNKKISIRTNKMATDAIAIIVNHQFPDSILTTNKLREILTGKINTWNQWNPGFSQNKIDIVIDKGNSSNMDFLKMKLNLNTNAISMYSAGSNNEVMEYVRKNKTSMGIVGVNLISDDEDPDLQIKLKQIKVLALAKENKKDDSKYYQPLQTNLGKNMYPLTRSIYIINKNTKAGLGAGFSSYILSDQGQRIVLKSGLLPAIMPGREIEIK